MSIHAVDAGYPHGLHVDAASFIAGPVASVVRERSVFLRFGCRLSVGDLPPSFQTFVGFRCAR